VDRRFSEVFSFSRPKFIYRIKNRVTLTCDFSKKQKTKVTTFAIFSNSFGDIDTEDFRDNLFIRDLFPSNFELRSWIADDAEDVYNTKLPMNIKNQLDAVHDDIGPQIRFRKNFANFFSTQLHMGRILGLSLWTPKEFM
jgi:hypothetical protein